MSSLSTTKNHHFVPQFLTKPWEDAQKNLRLYSFETSDIQKEPAKTALSTEEDYPEEIESFLHKQLESPFNDLRTKVQRGEDVVNEPKFARAALLLIHLQRARNRAVAEKAWFHEVNLLLKKSPQELIEGLPSDQGLLCVQTKAGSRPLWFPSSGSYYLLAKDLAWKGKRFVPLAIPLDPQRVLISYPLAADADLATRNGMREIISSKVPGLLEDGSVGMDTATRVVIPPGVKESDEEIAAMLQQARQKNKQGIVEHNQAVAALIRANAGEQ